MADKNYTLARPEMATLVVDGVQYELSQVVLSYAVNTLPVAHCLLAVGRNASTQQAATVHRNNKFTSMKPAEITVTMSGEWADGVDWPFGPVTVFKGYFCGFAPRKVMGKMVVVARLVHGLAALTFSSAVTKFGHPSNPASMNASAIPFMGGTVLAGSSKASAYVSDVGLLRYADLTGPQVAADVWQAIKTIFCGLANLPARTGGLQQCQGSGSPEINHSALEVLNDMEGPAPQCATPYRWAVPLQMQIPDSARGTLETGIARAISQETVLAYAGTTFWDKLVGQFCPMFGLAVVPRGVGGIVIADTPMYRGNYWRTIGAGDYDNFDYDPNLTQPLSAVTVLGQFENPTMRGLNGAKADDKMPLGCFAEDASRPADGLHRYVESPPWLSHAYFVAGQPAVTAGVGERVPTKSATSPSPSQPPPLETISSDIGSMYDRYAEYVFAVSGLQGRTGTMAGKLRFDIAPGSLLRIEQTSEKFDNEIDDLSRTMFACAARVTCVIDVEGRQASTSFQLTHVRTEQENESARTSVSRHPLFGTSFHGDGRHGCPLVDEYEFPASTEPND